jgi:ParB family chromosome partitioning protein
VTQKGVAMIGDLRTEALHQALAATPIEDDTLLGLLILAFGCGNVSVDSGTGLRGADLEAICRALTEGGVLTTDLDLLRPAARRMLVGVLSCRENRSQNGPLALIAGEAIGASLPLPNMATEDSCRACRAARWSRSPGPRVSTSHPARRTRGHAWSRASRMAPSSIRPRSSA